MVNTTVGQLFVRSIKFGKAIIVKKIISIEAMLRYRGVIKRQETTYSDVGSRRQEIFRCQGKKIQLSRDRIFIKQKKIKFLDISYQQRISPEKHENYIFEKGKVKKNRQMYTFLRPNKIKVLK